MKNERALNLVETCIAIVIVSIIVSSMWGIATLGYRYMNKYKQLTRARLLAQEGMEDILVTGYCGGRWSDTDILWQEYNSSGFLSSSGDDYEGFSMRSDFYNCSDTATPAINTTTNPPLRTLADPADPPECPGDTAEYSNIAFVRVRVTWDNDDKEYVLESLVNRMNQTEMCCPSSETVYYADEDPIDGELEPHVIECPDGCSC